MLVAQIDKVGIVQDQKTSGTVLVGVASYYEDKVNFKVPYDWDTLDIDWFTKTLKEKLAEDFNLPPYRVDIKERQLLEKMEKFSRWYKQEGNK